MIPPPPRSTLFPYTTLFRSLPGEHPRVGVHQRVQEARQPRHEGRGRGRRLDRKSTRLNSSHTVISYAVFCLKKKKIKKISTDLNVDRIARKTNLSPRWCWTA